MERLIAEAEGFADGRSCIRCSGGTMRTKVELLAGLWVVAFLSLGSLAHAADADLRLVQAAAEQNRDAVRRLLREKVDVNAAPPAPPRCCGRRTGTTSRWPTCCCGPARE